MTTIILLIVCYVIGMFFLIARRNSDPWNQKCAEEICDYLRFAPELDAMSIYQLFTANARRQKQAVHVITMVPIILQNIGHSKEQANSYTPLLSSAAFLLPK